jgi:hypothetical protein
MEALWAAMDPVSAAAALSRSYFAKNRAIPGDRLSRGGSIG